MPFCVSTPLSLQNPLLSLVNEKPKSSRDDKEQDIKEGMSASIRFLLCPNVPFVMSTQTYFITMMLMTMMMVKRRTLSPKECQDLSVTSSALMS